MKGKITVVAIVIVLVSFFLNIILKIYLMAAILSIFIILESIILLVLNPKEKKIVLIMIIILAMTSFGIANTINSTLNSLVKLSYPINSHFKSLLVELEEGIENISYDREYNSRIEYFFDKFNKSCEDEFCFIENTTKLLINQYYVYDFNNDSEKDCKDYAITFCYWMRKNKIPCWIILTKEHALTLIKIGMQYMIFDPSNPYPLINDYIIGELFDQEYWRDVALGLA